MTNGIERDLILMQQKPTHFIMPGYWARVGVI